MMKPTTAIRTRLTLYLSAGIAVTWLIAGFLAMWVSLHELNKAEDSQMSELARALPYMVHNEPIVLNDIDDILDDSDNEGEADDKHNGIAVWNADGVRILSDRKGENIPYQKTSGFYDIGHPWQKHAWRVLYLHHPTSGQTVAVAQRWEERFSILFHAITAQFWVFFAALPILAWLIARAIKHSLSPLDELADELNRRDAASLMPFSENVPGEIRPMIRALNHLMEKVQTAIEREQRFTADAAHELRSPLAALRVQIEAWTLSENEAERQHHIRQIQQGLTRAERLVNQLLTLAKLEPQQALGDTETIDWAAVSHAALQSVSLSAREKHITLQRHLAEHETPLPLQGNPLLLQLMLRNLLENAVRHSPSDSVVTLSVHADHIEVRDYGSGIAPEHLAHITERFYRPAGQNDSGSGLGLSIVSRIAELHGLTVTLENCTDGGLSVVLKKRYA